MGKSLFFITVLIAWLVVGCESGFAPKIIRAFGDGVTEGNLVEKIVVLGEHFTEDCKAQLIRIADMGNPIDVSVQYISESELQVVLDSAIAGGSYSLEVANDFGMDSVSLIILNGAEGSTGSSGPSGPQGEIGPTGPNGSSGPGGPDGQNGQGGPDGQDGVCWNSIKPEIERIGCYKNGSGPFTLAIILNGSRSVADLEFGLMTPSGTVTQNASLNYHNQFSFTPFQPNGSYTFMAVASDNCQLDFLTVAMIDPVCDIDGNFYNTVTLNGQVWMAENLKVTHYNNGLAIPLVTGTSVPTTPAYFNYADTPANADIYGRLYNWYAANGSDLNICPTGWYLPTDDEWTSLTTYLGQYNGGKMKETGYAHWHSPNEGATNTSGFSALPGGYRDPSGFAHIGNYGYWWSASADDNWNSWSRYLGYDYAGVFRSIALKSFGFSVRCVRD